MCNFSTDSQMSLKNHRALTCSDSVFTKFQCDFCPFQSQATRMIRSHIEREHSTIPKPSPKLNSKHFLKTSSEEEGSLYSDDNQICLLYAGKLKPFFILLRIFVRNPLKNETLDISQKPARKKLTIPQSPNPPEIELEIFPYNQL